jgi:hypothetical protein
MKEAAEALGMSYQEYGRTSQLGDGDLTRLLTHLRSAPVAAHVDWKDKPDADDSLGDHWILLTNVVSGGLVAGINPATGRRLHLSTGDGISVANARAAKMASKRRGILYGYPGCGSHKQEESYIVVRFALLSTLANACFVS